MGLETANAVNGGRFTNGQKAFLEFHRECHPATGKPQIAGRATGLRTSGFLRTAVRPRLSWLVWLGLLKILRNSSSSFSSVASRTSRDEILGFRWGTPRNTDFCRAFLNKQAGARKHSPDEAESPLRGNHWKTQNSRTIRIKGTTRVSDYSATLTISLPMFAPSNS